MESRHVEGIAASSSYSLMESRVCDLMFEQWHAWCLNHSVPLRCVRSFSDPTIVQRNSYPEISLAITLPCVVRC